MNILVANISTMPFLKEGNDKSTLVRTYEVRVSSCSVDSITAVQTNESILKCVTQLEDVIRTGGLHRVVALVSKKAKSSPCAYEEGKTALEYIQRVLQENAPAAELCTIDIEDAQEHEKATAEILDELCSYISSSDHVYIDGAGGKRTIVNILQLLTKILQYKGIDSPCTLYADVQGKPNYIADTSEFIRMTNLTDAFNEFMTTGKADQLERCIPESQENADYAELLRLMCSFSDKIRIGDVESLDETLHQLRMALKRCHDNQAAGSIETVVLQQFLQVIEDRLVASEGDKADYVKVVQWCLDNQLIQQALTIFVEKIPAVVFEAGILIFKGDMETAKAKHNVDKKTNKTLPSTWEHWALYSDLLSNEGSSGLNIPKNSPLVEELKAALLKNGKVQTPIVQNAIQIVKSFELKFPRSSNHSGGADVIREMLKKTTTLKSYGAFVRTLANQNSTMQQLLCGGGSVITSAQERPEGDKTISQKLDTLLFIERQNTFGLGAYSSIVPLDNLLPVLYGYVYAKALRNQINHASSEENLTESQKSLFAAKGYEMDFTSLKSIKNNLQRGLDALRVAMQMAGRC